MMQDLDPGKVPRKPRQRLAKIKSDKTVTKIKVNDSRNNQYYDNNKHTGLPDDSLPDVIGGSTGAICEQVAQLQKPLDSSGQKALNGNNQSNPNNNNRDEIETNLNQNRFGLSMPYQFLSRPNPPISTILVPHFTWKSITFWYSVLTTLMFVVLLIVYATKEQDAKAWGCLLYKTQNKFYPRLRYNYQVWRIVVSVFFHGSISHLVLNVIGLQVYGYFVEWYYGKSKLALALGTSILTSHLLSCLINVVSVSSTSSAVLYTVLGLKIGFFIKYRNFPPLDGRRPSLYGLFALIFGINLIVLFVGSNADVGAHLAGFIVGLLFAGIYYDYQVQEDQDTRTRMFKYFLIFLLVAFSTILIGVAFGLNTQLMSDLNIAIDGLC